MNYPFLKTYANMVNYIQSVSEVLVRMRFLFLIIIIVSTSLKGIFSGSLFLIRILISYFNTGIIICNSSARIVSAVYKNVNL